MKIHPVIAVCLCILFGFFCLITGEEACDTHWHKLLIERGFAEFNRTTGAWQFIDSDELVCIKSVPILTGTSKGQNGH